MTRVTVDSAIADKLHGIAQVVELCDPTGRVLGRFVPAVDRSAWEPLSPGASEEELERRAKSSERRYTTAEVLARLEKR